MACRSRLPFQRSVVDLERWRSLPTMRLIISRQLKPSSRDGVRRQAVHRGDVMHLTRKPSLPTCTPEGPI